MYRLLYAQTRVIPLIVLISLAFVSLQGPTAAANINENDLRLIPFPKQIEMKTGNLAIHSAMRISVSASSSAQQASDDLRRGLVLVTGINCPITVIPQKSKNNSWLLAIHDAKVSRSSIDTAFAEVPTQDESYRLLITKKFAAVKSANERGFVWGIQTLRQLIRANTTNRTLPCLDIIDWPSLKYRGWQDDITRGPSPTLQTLQNEVVLTSLLKMNLFSYYLEHQFAFSKHPDIGPKDGSLTPDELKKLVEFSDSRSVELIGCQQSFGHLYTILKNDAYANLRENWEMLNPVIDDSYKFLEDLYSEQAPIIHSELFNVCCDETEGLGSGPSKSLAEKIGVGGVYAQHMKRVHDLLKDKFDKRMMMWGDIILRYPDHLNEIPKDVIMLSWGYDPRDSFESQITPFSNSGYDFFVCPGMSSWSRILPDFAAANTNIHNFVRDGVKLGAMGMLNTTWDDDGESFGAYNWYGAAWGAECAWNGSATSIEDFNRRVGGVLFGETTDNFGKAIALLSKTHQLPGFDNMFDRRYWRFDDGHLDTSRDLTKEHAKALIDITESALDHLKAAKSDAKVNGLVLDYYIFGAERMRAIAERCLAFIDAAETYEQARYAVADPQKAGALIEKNIKRIESLKAQNEDLKTRYTALWNKENRPYFLDTVLSRYNDLSKQYDTVVDNLNKAKNMLQESHTLPCSRDIGMDITEPGIRDTRADETTSEVLSNTAEWGNNAFKKRIGISITGDDIKRYDQPIELDLPLASELSSHARLYELDTADKQTPIACQLVTTGNAKRIYFLTKGDISPKAKRSFLLYFDPDNASDNQIDNTNGVMCSNLNGNIIVENKCIRLQIGNEGAHIYKWEIKALQNLDITEPGEKDWFGFADNYYPHRNANYNIDVISNGPVLVRLRCEGSTGLNKTISVWADVPWVEVTYDWPVAWFSCYDNASIMGAESATPGNYLFSDGESGKIKPNMPSAPCQVIRENVTWSAKYVLGGCMLALVTPEVAARHLIGPGGGMGGVMIEGGIGAAHYVVYGDVCPKSPKDTLDCLRATLNYQHPPTTTIYKVENRK